MDSSPGKRSRRSDSRRNRDAIVVAAARVLAADPARLDGGRRGGERADADVTDTWLPMAVGGPALAGQPVTLVGEGRRRHSIVAMRDVVSYAVAALERTEANNQRLLIGGPEAISWRDAVAAFEHELGREVPVRTVRWGTLSRGCRIRSTGSSRRSRPTTRRSISPSSPTPTA